MTELRDRRGLYGMGAPESDLRAAFTGGAVPVAVYGLGKMGLPLAAVFAGVTGNTVGVDVDEAVVRAVNRGECPVDHEPHLPRVLERAVEEGALTASADPAGAADTARVHVLIVPTTVHEDGTPDLSTLRTALRSVGEGLEPGDFVAIESTVPPRTCVDVAGPLLEAESGLELGEFGLAFCPERTASGRALRDIRGAYPKVVGGIDRESTRVAELVYGEVTTNDVIPVADATTAECVKVFEGVYRDVNIALANELATFADELEVDVTEAIDVANTQPFCDIHTPGPGVGGHCIPYYPYFLIREFDTDAPLLRTAREVNDSMPAFTTWKLVQALGRADVAISDATVAVLGLSYRAGVPETRESPGAAIAAQLRELGATVYGVDPVLESFEEFDVEPVSLSELPALGLDAAVLATAHEEFADVDWTDFDDLAVVDGRDALALGDADHRVYTIGRGWTG